MSDSPIIIWNDGPTDKEFIEHIKQKRALKKKRRGEKAARIVANVEIKANKLADKIEEATPKLQAFANRINATNEKIRASNKRLYRKWFGKKDKK